MPDADTQRTVRGERRPKGRENFLCLNFFCLSIKYEFYFTLIFTGVTAPLELYLPVLTPKAPP